MCRSLTPFQSDPELVILIHPRETKRAIGTARLAHLSIQNSVLIRGDAPMLDRDSRLRSWAEDTDRRSVVLFPGPGSLDLDDSGTDLSTLVSAPRGIRVFVIDGTWSEARKMVQRSEVLSRMPQIMFRPDRPSNYRIRKQPKPVCVSTIEAIHALLERCAERGLGRLPEGHAHDGLLDVFERMVDLQIVCRDGAAFTKAASE
ncbi:MAG: DTW domain-containing protein [Bdellovibrionaceae bacterium]|nr:DTW domain-containing protein [Pseudobdellovibrionaceae bacterium]